MLKKYNKKELLDIINKILLNKECALKYINIFQQIMWGEDENKNNLYDLNEKDRELMLDLALDLDFYNYNISKKDKLSGIKDIKKDRKDLIRLLQGTLSKLQN